MEYSTAKNGSRLRLEELNIDSLAHIIEYLDTRSVNALFATCARLNDSMRILFSKYPNSRAACALEIVFNCDEINTNFCGISHYFQQESPDDPPNPRFTKGCPVNYSVEIRKPLYADVGYHYHRSPDPIRAVLSFLLRILMSPTVRISKIKMVEHPWFVKNDFDTTSWLHREEEDLNRYPHTLQLIRAIAQRVSPSNKAELNKKSSDQHVSDHTSVHAADWRNVHLRLLTYLGASSASMKEILREESRRGYPLVLSENSVERIGDCTLHQYRELECKRILPTVIHDLFNEVMDGYHKFYL